MRSLSMAGCLVVVALSAAQPAVRGESKAESRPEARDEAPPGFRAEVIDSKIVWNEAPYSGHTDLIRFRDRWYLVFMEASAARSNDGVIRVVSSSDGEKWESIARNESPTPGRSVSLPKLTKTPDGNLLLTAAGIVPTPTDESPLPQWGGTLQELGWLSSDGRRWDAPHRIGPHDWSHGRIAWRDTTAYVYSHGTICGIMHVLRISARRDGGNFEVVHEATPGHFPDDAALVFDGDNAFCLASQISEENRWGEALVGTAKAPFEVWTWKPAKAHVSHPGLLRLEDGTLLAAARFQTDSPHTAICEFAPKAGELRPLVALPANARSGEVGLAWHEGHLWVSYRAEDQGKSGIALSRIRLTRLP